MTAVVVNQTLFVQKCSIVKQRFAASSANLKRRLVLMGGFDETENIYSFGLYVKFSLFLL